MNDPKLIVRLMAAISTAEEKGMDIALFSETALQAPEELRDKCALWLLREGYIRGLRLSGQIDGLDEPHIFWNFSNPEITSAGADYIQEIRL